MEKLNYAEESLNFLFKEEDLTLDIEDNCLNIKDEDDLNDNLLKAASTCAIQNLDGKCKEDDDLLMNIDPFQDIFSQKNLVPEIRPASSLISKLSSIEKDVQIIKNEQKKLTFLLGGFVDQLCRNNVLLQKLESHQKSEKSTKPDSHSKCQKEATVVVRKKHSASQKKVAKIPMSEHTDKVSQNLNSKPQMEVDVTVLDGEAEEIKALSSGFSQMKEKLGKLRSESSRQHQATGSSHEVPRSNLKKTRYRPKRFCIFCKRNYRDLSLHLTNIHSNEKSIRQINGMSKREREKSLRFIRVAGINEENEIRKKNKLRPIYIRNQNTKFSEMVKCLNCQGMFGRKYFYLHRKNCDQENIFAKNKDCITPSKILNTNNERIETPFTTDILNSLHRDEIGNFILENEEVLLLGFNLYEDILVKDKPAVKKVVANHMRTVTRLFFKVRDELKKKSDIEKEPTVFEIFARANVILINQAAREMSQKNGTYLAAMHRNYRFEIRKVIKSLLKIYDDQNLPTEVERVRKFKNMFEHEWPTHYTEAGVKTRNKKNEKTLSKHLSLEKDVDLIQNFLNKELDSFEEDTIFDNAKFLRLRKALLCRLILFNSCRPNEVAELMIEEWEKAKTDRPTSIPQYQIAHLSAKNKEILKECKVVYHPSKNTGEDVSIFFPQNIWNYMNTIINQEVRAAAGINPENVYVFPSLNSSKMFSSPWHDIKRCCQEAIVYKNICTLNSCDRLASTMGVKTTATNRSLVLSNGGYSQNTRQSWYQHFQGIKAICSVTPFLEMADRAGELNEDVREVPTPDDLFVSATGKYATEEDIATSGNQLTCASASSQHGREEEIVIAGDQVTSADREHATEEKIAVSGNQLRCASASDQHGREEELSTAVNEIATPSRKRFCRYISVGVLT